jgi:hypothetical protein
MHVAIILMLQSCAVPADTSTANTPPSNVHTTTEGKLHPDDGYTWANPHNPNDYSVVAIGSTPIPPITGSTEPTIIIGPTTTVSTSAPRSEYDQARAEYDEALSAYETAQKELRGAQDASVVTDSVINGVIRPSGLLKDATNVFFRAGHIDQISKAQTNYDVAVQRLDRAKTRLYNLETR